MQDIERRKTERFQAAYPIEQQEGELSRPLDIENVSEGGLAFNAKEAPAQRDNFNIKIYLKNRMFRIKAVIVHFFRNDDGSVKVGVRFQETPESFKKELRKEMNEVREFQRECHSYNKKLSFKEASLNYLKNIFPWDI